MHGEQEGTEKVSQSLMRRTVWKGLFGGFEQTLGRIAVVIEKGIDPNEEELSHRSAGPFHRGRGFKQPQTAVSISMEADQFNKPGK